ncbi:MAG: NYN domain-containing protein [Thermoplasmata archaeon]|nr:NYN domain-containing protein [Thermoplasmata archaeon]
MAEKADKEPKAQRNIAFLVDGDNAQPKLLERMIREAEKQGTITIRRIYGDWTTPNMNGWKDTIHIHATQPIQQFRYTVGKNATDSALIIDAMDILHSGVADGFCIVSSDSDYTRLATRIREEGVYVMGIGEKKTPKAFVKACDLFVYTENITPQGNEKPPAVKTRTKSKKTEKQEEPLPLLIEAFEMVMEEDGWARLSAMGSALLKIDPGFDPRSYGQKQLSQLIKAHSKTFELKYKDETGPTTVSVRMK